jgi:hypothetical protein
MADEEFAENNGQLRPVIRHEVHQIRHFFGGVSTEISPPSR